MSEKSIQKYPCVLVLAQNPGNGLTDYIRELTENGFHCILAAENGGRKNLRNMLDEAGQIEGCEILCLDEKAGKGYAIKAGVEYYLRSGVCRELSGVITVEGVGRYAVRDLQKIAEAMDEHPQALVLGRTDPTGSGISSRGRFDNAVAGIAFRLLYGKKIRDTLSGLRGYPNAILADFVEVRGKGQDYETNVLVAASRKKIPIVETDTGSMCGGSGVYARTFADSIAMYFLLVKSFCLYMCSSVLSFVVDMALFQLFVVLLNGKIGAYILAATVMARAISSLFNYFINRNVVFAQKNGAGTMKRYYTLCVCQTAVSGGLVTVLYGIWPISETLIKFLVDCCLFCISYRIQQAWVFADRKTTGSGMAG